MIQNKLKIGILLDSYVIPAWAFLALERIVNLDCVDISVIILNNNKDAPEYKPDLYNSNNHNITYRLLNKIDNAIFRRGPDAFAAKDAQKFFGDVPVIRVKPDSQGEPGCFGPSEIKEILSYQLDILIRMGFESLTGEILNAAKFGVWSYYHGDHQAIRSNLPGFWEVANRETETGSILYILKNNSTFGPILYKSWIQTYPLSPARNRNRCFWVCSSFLPRQIELLYRLGETGFFTEIEKYNPTPVHKDIRLYSSPSNIQVLRTYLSLFIRNIREIFLRSFFLDQWYLLFEINSHSTCSFSDFKEIIPPKDRFWADPHIIQSNDKYYIFVEELINQKRKAHLSVIEMDSNGNCKEPIQILSKNYHLSYPFVFKWNDNYYMIPETSENRTIELYECITFPYEWKFRMNLMENILAVDTTLLYYQEKWWLFTGITENEGTYPLVELFLFSSAELLSKNWTPHPLNPIISDVKKARPAGKIFIKDGKIYRPSQDYSNLYRWGFGINEIIHLSETGYLEKEVAKINPDWNKNIEFIHTFAQAGSLTMIDACQKKWKGF